MVLKSLLGRKDYTPKQTYLPPSAYTPIISRLLSAAAAATASSSYAIYADGSLIQIPLNAHSPAPSHHHTRPTSHPAEMPLAHSSKDKLCPGSLPEHHPHNSAEHAQDSHADSQTTLWDALRAAFGGALVNMRGNASVQQSPASPASVGSRNQRVPSLLPSTAAPPAPSSPPISPLPSSAQSPVNLPRKSAAASLNAALAARSSQCTSLRITQWLGLAHCSRKGSSFLQQNTYLRPQQLSRNSLLKQEKSPMTQDMMPTTWEALSASCATYRRTWAIQFCWYWAGRQPAQEECGRV
ncbi:hypothetical protein PCASD_23568 [Puccinia coronata f. sp. avenae]|uniref:Uncharacterized protein n=1 Tax=Puccinia coronata f. sp. avenae TaxID=200324 RepID=A0A2N5SQV0_9BASI|nr:hypothetical protein PCASD_23568 [Puccinia coronata f. sp. avenae]